MNVLTRKDERWWWEKAQQKAFDKLKRIFTSKLVLVAPDLDKEFRVEADASNYATRGVLSMKCSDERWRPVAFISKSLSCHKLHSAISSLILHRFSWSQWLQKALEKTFQ